MRTSGICPTCATYTNALCTLYNGPYLTNLLISPLDSLEYALTQINNAIAPKSGVGAPTFSATYVGQLYVNRIGPTLYYSTSAGTNAADWESVNNSIGYVPEDQALKSTDGTFTANSDVLYPSQKATKTYVNSKLPLTGAIAPVINASFYGQLYVDTAAQNLYFAKAIGTGASDWKLL